MNSVEVSSEGRDRPPSPGSIVTFLQAVLSYLQLDGCELSVLLCDLDTIQELNRTYRGKDEPTDVLSFSQREGHGPAGNGPPGNDLLRPESLGDIVACLPIVEDQAHRFGCSPDQELRRVLTHGVLHLIGMNHETNQPEEGMLALQERILRALEPAELSW